MARIWLLSVSYSRHFSPRLTLVTCETNLFLNALNKKAGKPGRWETIKGERHGRPCRIACKGRGVSIRSRDVPVRRQRPEAGRVHVRLRQYLRDRSVAGRAADRTQLAAKGELRSLCRAALRLAFYRAAGN